MGAIALPDIESARLLESRGHLYVAIDSNDNTKVGFSRNIYRRLYELRRGRTRNDSDSGIQLIGAINSDIGFERNFHSGCREDRAEFYGEFPMAGEWYKPRTKASEYARFIISHPSYFGTDYLEADVARATKQAAKDWDDLSYLRVLYDMIDARPITDHFLCCLVWRQTHKIIARELQRYRQEREEAA